MTAPLTLTLGAIASSLGGGKAPIQQSISTNQELQSAICERFQNGCSTEALFDLDGENRYQLFSDENGYAIYDGFDEKIVEDRPNSGNPYSNQNGCINIYVDGETDMHHFASDGIFIWETGRQNCRLSNRERSH
jgi:hypothetical protein